MYVQLPELVHVDKQIENHIVMVVRQQMQYEDKHNCWILHLLPTLSLKKWTFGSTFQNSIAIFTKQ